MELILEAIYEGGVLRPFESLKLQEHQRVIITITTPLVQEPNHELELWHQVYEGLSDQEINEVESIALDRDNFFG